MKPVGPDGPETYWKRRAVVVGAVLIVIFLLWLVFRPSSGPEASSTSTPTPVASISGPSSSESGTGVECPASAIQVATATDREAYPADANPKVTMTITNSSQEACQRDVGAASNEIQISSGGVLVYSTDNCSDANQTDVVELKPGDKASVTVQWDRTNNTQDCNGGRTVEAGAYEALGRNGDVEGQGTTFVLQ
jgi:hypothetical protein